MNSLPRIQNIKYNLPMIVFKVAQMVVGNICLIIFLGLNYYSFLLRASFGILFSVLQNIQLLSKKNHIPDHILAKVE